MDAKHTKDHGDTRSEQEKSKSVAGIHRDDRDNDIPRKKEDIDLRRDGARDKDSVLGREKPGDLTSPVDDYTAKGREDARNVRDRETVLTPQGKVDHDLSNERTHKAEKTVTPTVEKDQPI